jgi:hypothetical protein
MKHQSGINSVYAKMVCNRSVIRVFQDCEASSSSSFLSSSLPFVGCHWQLSLPRYKWRRFLDQ